MKTCTVCKEKKPLTEFYKNVNQCKLCVYKHKTGRTEYRFKSRSRLPIPPKGFETCLICMEVKPLANFSKRVRKNGKQEIQSCCKSCHHEKYSCPLKAKRQRLKRSYGLALDEFNKLYDSFEGQCHICKKKITRTGRGNNAAVVDHCHETGQVRGLLCSNCNFVLGHSKDDTEILANAIAYLTRSVKHEEV